MSLYPYICKYFKFPIGHPVVHVGDTCKDIRACLQMEGLIKCTIVPPMDLYLPVLPFRCNKNLLFCLVGRAPLNTTCEERVGISPTPKWRSVARGSWTRYEWPSRRVTESWRFTKCTNTLSHRTMRLQAWADCLYSTSTLLKLKAESSGYPSWVRTPADEDRYIEEFRQSEGILLDKDSIRQRLQTSTRQTLSKFDVGQTRGEPEENTNTVNFRHAGIV